ncbi:ATP-binding cassette domain-containing protein [Paracoccus saliphilus]|uniref:ATP-binding cassette domain-containing protein n=1 Tax=Paracoccus saliphilus TaxID=405559 RepID=A0ABY7S7K2_9RHOB|nr:ATP-binding cassette domain-containing protein [Paracoccus saliphilus]
MAVELPEGKILAFCGPNGSGKSTMLRVMRGAAWRRFRHGRDRGKLVAS